MRRLVFRFLLILSLGALGCGDGSGESGGSAGSGGVGGIGGVMFFDPGPTCIAFCARRYGLPAELKKGTHDAGAPFESAQLGAVD